MRIGPHRNSIPFALPLAAALVLATLSAGMAQTPPLEELISAVVRIKTFINPDGRTLQNLGREREGSGHRHRRQWPGADHRLPDGGGAYRRDHHQRWPHLAGERDRIRQRYRLRIAAGDLAAQDQAAGLRQVRRRQGTRCGCGGELRRAGTCRACPRRRQARIRRLLGVHARRSDLHLAAAPAMERGGADQPRGQAGRRRLAHRRAMPPGGTTTSPATCSCRSTGCRRSSAT